MMLCEIHVVVEQNKVVASFGQINVDFELEHNSVLISTSEILYFDFRHGTSDEFGGDEELMSSGQGGTWVVQADNDEVDIETILVECSMEHSHSGNVGDVDHGHKQRTGRFGGVSVFWTMSVARQDATLQ